MKTENGELACLCQIESFIIETIREEIVCDIIFMNTSENIE